METSQNIFHFSFSEGIELIEANAGTGKTFSIEVIYLKALVELRLEVHQILLVTYTKEVTNQMKKRIFDAIEIAHNYLIGFNTENDYQTLLDNFEDKEEAKRLLYRALIHFDEIAIFSIHSFATQWNQEFFTSSFLGRSSDLSSELEKEFFEDILHSFWIKEVLKNNEQADFFFASFDRERKEYKEIYSKLAGKMDFIQDCYGQYSTNIPLSQALQNIKKDFHYSDFENLNALMKEYGMKSKQKKSLEGHFEVLKDAITSKNLLCFEKSSGYYSGWIENLQAQQNPEIQQILKQNKSVVAFLDCLLAEKKLIEEYRKKFLLFANKELKKYKKEYQFYNYDDIIFSFYQITKKQKQQTKYQLVVIDEFQDTDWIQSNGFLNLFAKTKIILVGDPKQAIFSFRGGDVFSYLQMKRDFVKKQTYKLDQNWRSQKDIVENVNLLFQQNNSFLYSGIDYFPSKATKGGETPQFFYNEKPQKAWKIWDFVDSDKDPEVETAVHQHLVEQVSNLIVAGQKGEAKIEGKPLEPQMICILVPTNNDVSKIRKALSSVSIFATARIKFPIQQTEEFQNWWKLLQTIHRLEQDYSQRIGEVLLSNFFGFTLEELKNLSPKDWDKIFLGFQELNITWKKKGFLAMINQLLTKNKIEQNLLFQGHQAITNFYHSLDWYLERNHQKQSVELFMKSIAEEILQEQVNEDLRLESDKNTVKIMTIHKSKGLEFPIVFCPYLWKVSPQRTKGSFFHRQDEKIVPEKFLSFDLSFDQIYKDQILKEKNAENRRALYVALTRAKHQIHIYTNSSRSAERFSPFMELLDNLKNSEAKKQLDIISEQNFFSLNPHTSPLELDSTELLQPQKRTRKDFTKILPYSFSSLKRISTHKFLEPNFEEKLEILEKPNPHFSLEENLRKMPSGIAIGNLFHQVLELFDCKENLQEGQLEELIQQKISHYSLHPEWQPIIQVTCNNIYNNPLVFQNQKVILSKIPQEHKIQEMGFHLLLEKQELIDKVSGLHKKYPDNLALKKNYQFLQEVGISDSFLENICIGFIDLVFYHQQKYYILDWKSNNLGKQENYQQEGLHKVMQNYDYFLQYLLYYLALQKFLEVKKISQSIGGVFYLFIRGMQDSGAGVYFDSMEYMKDWR